MHPPLEQHFQAKCTPPKNITACENSVSFSNRIKSLSKVLSEAYSLKFLFPNAPFLLTPPQNKVPDEEKQYSWFDSDVDEKVKKRLAQERGEYKGFQTTQTSFESFLSHHDNVVAIFAFSQGAVLTKLLLIQACEKKLKVDLLKNLKCCILLGGLGRPLPSNSELANVLDYAEGRKQIEVPVMIVKGKNDGIVTREQAESLEKYFKNYQVWEHNGKHEIPKKKEDILKYMQFLDIHLKK